jgi:hypothetical protein
VCADGEVWHLPTGWIYKEKLFPSMNFAVLVALNANLVLVFDRGEIVEMSLVPPPSSDRNYNVDVRNMWEMTCGEWLQARVVCRREDSSQKVVGPPYVCGSGVFFFARNSSGFITDLCEYNNGKWIEMAASGTFPVQLEKTMFPLSNGWLMSVSKYNACIPLVKPKMAYFASTKFETQLEKFGPRIFLLDTLIVAYNNFVLLSDDQEAPSFLHSFGEEDVVVMQAAPVPLPSYLPRPN